MSRGERVAAPAARAAMELAPGVELPPDIVSSTISVLANRGAGKSTVTHRLVELMYGADLPVVVLDVKGDWWGIRSSADGKGAGLPFVIFGGDHGDVELQATAGELLADLIVDDRIPAVLDLSHMSKTQARSFATAFAERLYRRNRDPLHVVIEEADVLVPQRAAADTARLLGAMEDLAKRGRHRGIGMTMVSQRPQEVAKSALDLMETVILLRITGPRSIKAVREWISVNATDDDVTAQDVIASLPSLSTGEGWVWSPGFLRLLTHTHFPLFATFDSHATPSPGQKRVVPKARADIDLDKLGAEIAATRDRARDNDPRGLRAEISSLREQLGVLGRRNSDLAQQLSASQELLGQHAAELAAAREGEQHQRHRLDDATRAALRSAAILIESVLEGDTPPPPSSTEPGASSRNTGTNQRKPPEPQQKPTASAPASVAGVTATDHDSRPRFRAGAERMLTSLAKMAPLRLTKAQWGTVAHLRHTGGTWSTYLGELRRAGLVDETSAGFTLTDAGWKYLGHRPEPMTARELQQHYLGILRAGAARMLEAVIDAHPSGLTKAAVAAAGGLAVEGGTFSTYLGDLRRNGLVEQRGNRITATSILMRGAVG
jgi:hypothetical protein